LLTSKPDSNEGVGLSGLAVTAVTGQEWTTVVQNRVFDPLHMSSSYPAMTAALLANPNVQKAYTYSAAGTLVPGAPVDDLEVAPAGSIWSTASDVARFVATHLNGGLYQPLNVRVCDILTEARQREGGMDADTFGPVAEREHGGRDAAAAVHELSGPAWPGLYLVAG
jgi:CubicO group peptidase (beta-lactamase class C family)